jgi:hypothetical protein
MAYNLPNIITTIKNKDYKIYNEPYKLNIIGIRLINKIDQNKFDDFIAFFYYDNNGKIIGKIAEATTDPGTYFLKNPMKKKGTAILKAGQYVNAYMIGLHRNKYEALVQRAGPVTVIRDSDRDGYININNIEETGYYGINIHRASRGKNNVAIIDRDSAGCQVFKNEDDFNLMMQMAKKSRDIYGNKFTYILLDERDVLKNRIAGLLIAGIVLVATTLT